MIAFRPSSVHTNDFKPGPITPRSTADTRQVLNVAAAFAMTAAAVEVGVIAYRKAALGRIAFVSDDFAWMIPAAYLLIVVPGTLVLRAVTAAAHRPLSLAAIVGLLTVPLVFALLLPHTVIAWWASMALAAGAGVQLTRLAAASPPTKWLPPLRAAAVGLATAMAITGAVFRADRALTQRRSAAAMPASASRGPNVLLIVLDTVRSSNLSLHGYHRPTTPRLDRRAREATVFNWAMATAPWTLPSHGSLMTGLVASDLESGWEQPISGSPRTLAESLRSLGYATAGFSANLRYASYESGLARGFVHYDDYRFSWPLLILHSALTRMEPRSRLLQARSPGEAVGAALKSHIAPADMPARVYRPADQIAQAFLEWQVSVTDRPFFAFLNVIDAHGPYHAPASFRPTFERGPGPVDRYDTAIAWQDEVIDGVLETLAARGVLDHTLVVITSDHGEQFGEHGLTDHANSLYLPLLHVPLLIRYPGAVPAGHRVDTLVSLRDVPATILELAAAPDPGIGGTSLAVTWRAPLAVQGDVIAALDQGINVHDASPNARGAMVSCFDERLHYIRNGDGSEELYAYRTDTHELTNLSEDPAMRADLNRLRARLPVRMDR